MTGFVEKRGKTHHKKLVGLSSKFLSCGVSCIQEGQVCLVVRLGKERRPKDEANKVVG